MSKYKGVRQAGTAKTAGTSALIDAITAAITEGEFLWGVEPDTAWIHPSYESEMDEIEAATELEVVLDEEKGSVLSFDIGILGDEDVPESSSRGDLSQGIVAEKNNQASVLEAIGQAIETFQEKHGKVEYICLHDKFTGSKIMMDKVKETFGLPVVAGKLVLSNPRQVYVGSGGEVTEIVSPAKEEPAVAEPRKVKNHKPTPKDPSSTVVWPPKFIPDDESDPTSNGWLKIGFKRVNGPPQYYIYFNVTPQDAAGLLTAESKGQYMEMIKNMYPEPRKM
jgi:hypothetical protein